MRITRLTAGTCGTCGTVLDAHTALDDRQPQPGDFSVCCGCATVHVFTAALQLVPVFPADPLPPDVQRVVRDVRTQLRQRQH